MLKVDKLQSKSGWNGYQIFSDFLLFLIKLITYQKITIQAYKK